MNSYEQKQADRKARLEERAAKAASESQTIYNRARSMAECIPFGQPILVGHHSESRDRNFRGRIHNTFGKAFALNDKSNHLASRADSVGTGGISSDDPDAIAKLSAELDAAKGMQDRMKAENRVIRSRAGDEQAQIDGLLALGWLTNEQAADLVHPDFAGRIGNPRYLLSNNNANMRRIENRIKELQKNAERQDKEESGNGYTYREDTTENRVMFLFSGKPDAETRTLLKRHAFKWSPRRTAWVRQLNNAGIYAASQVRVVLNQVQE